MGEIPFVVHSSGYVVFPDEAEGYDCGGEGCIAEKTKTQSKLHKGNSPSAHFNKVRYSALHFSYVAMTRTQSRGGVRGTDGKAESNASRPSRAITRSQKALKDQAGKKGIVVLPPFLMLTPLCNC